MEDRKRRLRAGDAVAWAAACGLITSAAFLGYVATRYGGSWLTALAQVMLVASGLAGAAALWQRTGTQTLVTIVVVACVARAVLVPWPPFQSNDIYRYLWDGRLLAHGIDPYVVVPSSPQLHPLRVGDWLYPHIDWRDVPTLYPPFDLALFTLGAALVNVSHPSVVPLKLILLAGDLATLGLTVLSLRKLGQPMGRLALYAWNPLVIVEFGLNGHEESFAIAFVVATIVAFRAERPFGAGVALAGAILTKLYPAAFVPILFARRAFVLPAFACAAIVVAAYAPFVVWNRDVFGFLHAFAFAYHFNDSLHVILGTIGAAALFACALAIAAFARARGASVVAVLLGLEIAYLVSSSNVYPWYVTIFAALLPLVPNAFAGQLRPLALALVAWTALAPLAYLAPWAMPVGSHLDIAAHALEYAPLVCALAWYALRDWRRIATVLGIAGVCGCATPARLGPDVTRGAAFYAANCAICHTPTATSFIGPDLTHVAARRSRESLRAHIATSVPDGTTFSPTTVAALVAYLNLLNERSHAK